MMKLLNAPRALAALALLAPALAWADATYRVEVTNLTKGMTFTPVLVATTRKGDRFFAGGAPASDALEIIAESGDSAPLAASLDAFDIASMGFIGPGASDSVTLATRGRYQAVTLASMLIPTNDTFFAANGVDGPHGNHTISFTVPAYDAGTEANDELCVNLPGPGCDGDPGPVSNNGEGFVHIANGIRGVGDLPADLRDWRNPVARITITRLDD